MSKQSSTDIKYRLPEGTGTARVVITNVMPQVDGGKYPAKAIAGAPLNLSADVFCDGHDVIAACVLIRHEQEKGWQEWRMQAMGNDRYEVMFKPQRTGWYRFRVCAWVDHYQTWRTDLFKRRDAGQLQHVDLRAGALLLEQYLSLVPAARKRLLQGWIALMNDPGQQDAAMALVEGGDMDAVLAQVRDKQQLSWYSQQLSFEAERRKAVFSTWYELFPRSAGDGRHGTFRDVITQLPRIADMGFDVLYLPPIHPIGRVKRKGRDNALTAQAEDPGSPWAIGSVEGGHKAIHPELGSMKDFRQLVAAAARYDIEIALDLAFQCAPDHPYVHEHPQWFKWRPDGTVQYAENPPKKYEDILPFNFESPDWRQLWEELRSVVLFWIGKGIQIFRVDNPHTKSFAFWEWLIASVRSEHPEVIFLAEAFTRPRLMEQLAKAGFTQSYTYFSWRNTRSELEAYLTELTQTDKACYFRPNFWPNTPDILPPYLVSGGEAGHLVRLILAATLSASYGIYGPVFELGLNVAYPDKEEYADNEKYALKRWDWDQETRIRSVIRLINSIRKSYAALQINNNLLFAAGSNPQLICYTKTDPDSGAALAIVVNLDPFHVQSGTVCLPQQVTDQLPGDRYKVEDLLSGAEYEWHKGWNYVALDPAEMPAHLFRIDPIQ